MLKKIIVGISLVIISSGITYHNVSKNYELEIIEISERNIFSNKLVFDQMTKIAEERDTLKDENNLLKETNKELRKQDKLMKKVVQSYFDNTEEKILRMEQRRRAELMLSEYKKRYSIKN